MRGSTGTDPYANSRINSNIIRWLLRRHEKRTYHDIRKQIERHDCRGDNIQVYVTDGEVVCPPRPPNILRGRVDALTLTAMVLHGVGSSCFSHKVEQTFLNFSTVRQPVHPQLTHKTIVVRCVVQVTCIFSFPSAPRLMLFALGLWRTLQQLPILRNPILQRGEIRECSPEKSPQPNLLTFPHSVHFRAPLGMSAEHTP